MNRYTSRFPVVGFLTILTVVLSFASMPVAQEHPKSEDPKSRAVQEHPQEHPTAEEAQEHPEEHPVELSTVAVTKENLATAIRDYVAKQVKKNEGVFICEDNQTDETLRLTLKKVHEDRLSTLADDTYFVCADFITEDGKVYDLDIFLKGKSAENLAATEVTVHKEEGVARYTWAEVEGIWKKAPVKESKEEKKE